MRARRMGRSALLVVLFAFVGCAHERPKPRVVRAKVCALDVGPYGDVGPDNSDDPDAPCPDR